MQPINFVWSLCHHSPIWEELDAYPAQFFIECCCNSNIVAPLLILAGFYYVADSLKKEKLRLQEVAHACLHMPPSVANAY